MTGIICVNKAVDITSFGVVAKVRGICSERKAGHTGTLDPMATGVLPIMLGGATKFLNHIEQSDKRYTACFVLGKATDTLDITGNVVSECEVNVGAEEVEACLEKFRGVISQVPPMFSAKSVNGVRLYDLARQGKEIEREACEVEIKELELIAADDDHKLYTIDVLCSKGTYIRSLIDDIGRDLGCGATMTSLCRTMAMGFTLEDCVTLDELQERKDSGKGFADLIIDVDKLFFKNRKIVVSEAQAKRFSNGGNLDVVRLKVKPEENEICTVYDLKNNFLGLGQEQNGELKVLRLLAIRE